MIRFKQYDNPDMEFRQAVKKPIIIKCFQMNEPFEVETMEGLMRGEKGDWLMKGVSGELYPCSKNIFLKSYDIVE